MGAGTQGSLGQLGAPLRGVTFVVVDLETTGGSPVHDRITEVGAVKVRGGDVLGELQTLVDPGRAIPAEVSVLTGITPGMVAGHPPIEAVVPTLLEFCRGVVLVAHNARFDTAFLDAALRRLGYGRLDHPVVCTAALARRLVAGEVRDHRLATLARFFRARTVPVHRALADARATVDVFHGLLERAGSLGVVTLPDLVGFSRAVNASASATRRRLADGLPAAPGVYVFRSLSGEALYVGTATDLRARVRSYFGWDRRRAVPALLRETSAVTHQVCPTPLEAAVAEVRLIRRLTPRFNRRSRTPTAVWLKLTDETFPRLVLARTRRGGAGLYLGPLPRHLAERAAAAVTAVTPIRRCAVRMGPATRFAPCALAGMGRCLSPCDGSVDADSYAAVVRTLAAALRGDPSALLDDLRARMRALAAAERFEDAAVARDRLGALVAALTRTRRLSSATLPSALVAARPSRRPGALDVAVVHFGRLAASVTCPESRVDATAECLRRLVSPPPAHAGVGADPADSDEIELVSRWLEGPGARVLSCEGTLGVTVAGGRALADAAEQLRGAGRTTGRPGSELAPKRVRRGHGPSGYSPGPTTARRSVARPGDGPGVAEDA